MDIGLMRSGVQLVRSLDLDRWVGQQIMKYFN